MATQETVAKARSGRTKRNPVTTRNRLEISGKEAGYTYRIVNDTEDRVAQLQDRGYEVVSNKDVRIGTRRLEQGSPEGSVASMSVGGGIKGVVMRIPDEWYQEDQAAKNANIDRLEKQTKQQALDSNDYGKFEISSRT